MAGTTYNKPSRYDYVSRKVFDKQVDRWTRKVAALKEEIRELELKLNRLQTGQTTMLDFVKAMPKEHDCKDPTCKYCSDDWERAPRDLDSEGL